MGIRTGKVKVWFLWVFGFNLCFGGILFLLSLSIPLSNVNTKIYREREAYGIVVFILEATIGRLCTYLCMQIIYIYIWGFK